MAAFVDSTGKGVAVGGTLSVVATVISVIPLPLVTVKLPDNSFRTIMQQKSAPYTIGATPTLSGTVLGFVNAGNTAIVKESDGNLLTVPLASATAT
jgi:hypothetical protein